MNNWTVYKHTNIINGKIYIGITSNNPKKRWGSNGSGYLKKKNDKYCQPAMAYAILKYGWDNFDHEIIKTNISKYEAEELEKELICQYKSNIPEFGYNIENGGTRSALPDCVKNKMKKSRIGYHHSEETKQKISKSNIGKKFNEDVKEHLSDVHSFKNEITLENLPNNNKYNEKPCKCVETGICYSSIAAAAYSVKSYVGNISKCIIGERRRAGGYHWEEISIDEYNEYIKTL